MIDQLFAFGRILGSAIGCNRIGQILLPITQDTFALAGAIPVRTCVRQWCVISTVSKDQRVSVIAADLHIPFTVCIVFRVGLTIQWAGVDLDPNDTQHHHNLVADRTRFNRIFGGKDAQHDILTGTGAIGWEVADVIAVGIL